MKRLTLLTGVAAALAFGGTSAIAQMQQKGPEEKGGAQMQAPPSAQQQAPQPQTQQKKQEPGQQGAQKAEPKEKSTKGTAQTEPKDKATKGTAEKSTEPKGKGTAEKATEPKSKGTAEKAEPKDKATKGTAEKAPEPKDKATKGAAEKGSAGRVQLSEQQRTNVSQTLMKDQRVNRATNVNISVNIGTRVPRSVTLVALPASVISLVPQYRPYRYFVVEERICIVDPATYEIVDIIEISGQTAGRGDHGGGARLVLTEEERAIILSEVDMSGGSTLGLGTLTEGAEVPRNVQLRVFSDTIVQKVPKVRGYKFFSAENRLAIVDPQGAEDYNRRLLRAAAALREK